jgi:hypothetical protein
MGRSIDKYGGYIERNEAQRLFRSHVTSLAMEFALTKSLDCIDAFIRNFSFDMPPEPPTNYEWEAMDDAKNLITEYFMDEIIDQLINTGEASDNMYNDYDNGDGIFHETIVDRDYDLTEAAEVLNQLYRHEETDSGLWEGEDFERIAATKAAYTYGNAVYSEWNNLISEINEIDMELINTIAAEDVIKHHPEPENYDSMDDEALIEYVSEYYDDEFQETQKKLLTDAIKEICE